MAIKLYNMDVREGLKRLPDESINCCITSPPYWALRDYGNQTETIWKGDKELEEIGASSVNKCWNDSEHEWNEFKTPPKGGHTKSDNMPNVGANLSEQIDETSIRFGYTSNFCIKCGAWKGQLGLEPTFELYISHLCDIYDDVKRVLRKDGTCFVNLGDTYGGSGNSSGHTEETKNLGYTTSKMGASKGNQQATKGMEKSLCMIPFRFAIEMQNRGWILRNNIVWHKPNCMPCSVKDRFTVDFEYVFFFVKNKHYWFETQYEKLSEVTIKDIKKRRNLACLTGEHGSKHFDNPNSVFDKQKTGRLRTEFVNLEQGRNKRAVWTINSKYEDLEQEAEIRQGMSKGRGSNVIEKRDLTNQKEFVDKLRENFTIEQLVEKTGLPETHIAHWFRYDESGFAYPSKEDWEKVKTDLFPELLEVYYETDDINKNIKLGRLKRTTWTITTQPFKEAHFATFPPELVEPMIKSGSPKYICPKCKGAFS